MVFTLKSCWWDVMAATTLTLILPQARAQNYTPNPKIWTCNGTVRAMVKTSDTLYIGCGSNVVGTEFLMGYDLPMNNARGWTGYR